MYITLSRLTVQPCPPWPYVYLPAQFVNHTTFQSQCYQIPWNNISHCCIHKKKPLQLFHSGLVLVKILQDYWHHPPAHDPTHQHQAMHCSPDASLCSLLLHKTAHSCVVHVHGSVAHLERSTRHSLTRTKKFLILVYQEGSMLSFGSLYALFFPHSNSTRRNWPKNIRRSSRLLQCQLTCGIVKSSACSLHCKRTSSRPGRPYTRDPSPHTTQFPLLQQSFAIFLKRKCVSQYHTRKFENYHFSALFFKHLPKILTT